MLNLNKRLSQLWKPSLVHPGTFWCQPVCASGPTPDLSAVSQLLDPNCKARIVPSLLFIKDAGKILLINQTHASYNWR